MRRVLSISLTLSLLGLFFVSVCSADEEEKQRGMTSELYVGPYTATLQGRVQLPTEVTWEVYSAYVGVDETGERHVEDCVCLILDDVENGFWPVIVKMDIPTAENLLVRLREIRAIKKKYPQQGRQIAGMQCSLYTAPHQATLKGKIVLSASTKWEVDSLYLGILPGNKRIKEDCVLLVLCESQAGREDFWPLVCKMDMVVASDLISRLSEIIEIKKQVVLALSK